MARSLSPLQECRKKCFDAFRLAIKAAFDRFTDNLTGCNDAYAAAIITCRTDPDPVACRALADENHTDCLRQAAEILSNEVENARLQLENCLTMCLLQHGPPRTGTTTNG